MKIMEKSIVWICISSFNSFSPLPSPNHLFLTEMVNETPSQLLDGRSEGTAGMSPLTDATMKPLGWTEKKKITSLHSGKGIISLSESPYAA